jgi:hypothetical protein
MPTPPEINFIVERLNQENKGHIAIAVFVKNSDKPMPKQEKAIAEVARSP